MLANKVETVLKNKRDMIELWNKTSKCIQTQKQSNDLKTKEKVELPRDRLNNFVLRKKLKNGENIF